MLKFVVNGENIDLTESELIALDFEVNNLGKLETRQGFKSNDFNIVLSNANIKKLGFTNLTNLKSGVSGLTPYKKIPAAIMQDNNYLSIGFAQIVKVNNNQTATVSFFGSNADWFELIKNTSYCDLDFSEYAHNYTAAAIVNSFTNTEGYIYPLIDYGKFVNSAYGVTVLDFAPAVFISTIIKKAFQAVGYKVSGMFLENIYYKRITIPFSKKGWLRQSQEYIDERELNYNSDPKNITCPFGVWTPITFENVTKNNVGWFVSPNISVDVNVKVTFILDIDISISTGDPAPYIALVRNNNITSVDEIMYSIPFQLPSGIINGQIEFEVELEPSNDYQFAHFGADSFGSNTITVNSFSVEMFVVNEVLEGQPIDFCINLPNISITDLLLSLCYQFTLFFQVNDYTKTVTFFQFNEIYKNIPNAKNWSDKLDYSRIDELNFTEVVQNYAKNSKFVYQENDNDIQLNNYFIQNDSNFGSGQFEIDNDFIQNEIVLLESKFAPTINVRTFNGTTYLPSITVYELNNSNVFEAKIDPKPRILMYSGLEDISDLGYPFDTLEIEGSLGNETVTQIPFTYFFKSTLFLPNVDNFDFGLAFDVPNIPNPNDTTLIEKYYGELNKCLNASIYLKAFFQLRQSDIDSLDFSIPIYLGFPYNAYYFLNKIKQFRSSETLTECELIQLQ